MVCLKKEGKVIWEINNNGFHLINLCVLYKLISFRSTTKLHCVCASSSGFPVHPASWHGHWVSSPACPFKTRTTTWDLTTTVPPSHKYKRKKLKTSHIHIKVWILASKLRNNQKRIENTGNKPKQCTTVVFCFPAVHSTSLDETLDMYYQCKEAPNYPFSSWPFRTDPQNSHLISHRIGTLWSPWEWGDFWALAGFRSTLYKRWDS